MIVHQDMKGSNRQSGNVLFLILIAVALFAALSFAVTRSTQSGGSSANQEKADILAAQFASYGATLSSAITRVRLSSNCSETQLNFENSVMAHPDYWGGSTNSSAPSDGRCNIFGTQSGAVYWDARKTMPVYDKVESYLSFTPEVAVQDVGTENAELLMWLRLENSDFAARICKSMNERSGNTGNLESGTTNTNNWGYARGAGLVYLAAPNSVNLIGEDAEDSGHKGKMSGCLTGPSSHDSSTKILYYVLIPR